MKKKDFNPNSLYEKLMNAKNAAQAPNFASSPSDVYKVNIRPDPNIQRSLFKPDHLIPGGYLAHPITIKALKKDVFVGGESFEDLESLFSCHSCKKTIDLQFWHFCPFCEASFSFNN
jgi:hypothetical protein